MACTINDSIWQVLTSLFLFRDRKASCYNQCKVKKHVPWQSKRSFFFFACVKSCLYNSSFAGQVAIYTLLFPLLLFQKLKGQWHSGAYWIPFVMRLITFRSMKLKTSMDFRWSSRDLLTPLKINLRNLKVSFTPPKKHQLRLLSWDAIGQL